MLEPLALCPSEALAERGSAHSFSVLLHGQPVPAFVMRFEGQVVAYLNRCAHVPVEMDWQPGQFLDQDRRWILCAIHGAAYEPATGVCVGGPCRSAKLRALRVTEQAGQVLWWPEAPLAPLAAPAPQTPAAGTAAF